ncbi:MAG: hypothetical protein HKN78_03830 [Sphingomonadaceae bacterium]|nr:hypothetical protein [Sphingomonadaceae bacterium]
MVFRVVLGATALASAAIPAVAQQPLPYDIDNFFRVWGETPPPVVQPQARPEARPRAQPRREPISLLPVRRGPRIAYNLDGLFFNRVPDYVALGYRLEGLTDYVPPYRDGRNVTPLRYELDNLLFGLNNTRFESAAGAP